MKAMLDTNICIYIIKRRPQSVLDRFSAFPVGDIGISSITLAELEYGAAKSAQPRRNREALEEFVSPLDLAPFDRDAAEAYGRIRAALERKGLPIGAMDMLIAAHCPQPRCKLSNQQRNRIPASVWASRGELDLNRGTGSLRCSFWKSLRRVDFQSIPFSLPGSYFFAKNVLA